MSVERQALVGNTSDATGATNPYERVKLFAAYGYGLTGAGVKVGVVDDGFNLVDGAPRHNEFTSTGKITVLRSSAPLEGGSPTSPTDGAHGAHVSGLAVADRNGTVMMGVAYDAQLYLGMSPTAASGFTALFEEYRTSGVLVSSNSYGIPIRGDETAAWKPVATSVTGGRPSYEVTARTALAYRNAAGISSAAMMSNITNASSSADEWTATVASMKAFQTAGGVVVWANSNYGPNDIANGQKGLDDVDLGAALPLAFNELSGAWITVVNATSIGLSTRINGEDYVQKATKKENNIILNSAQCGIAASFCVAMDGSAVWSASNKGVGSYESQTGTSQATPQIAGMIALLRQAFPMASAADLTARLLFTANNGFFGSVSTVTTASYTNANGTITHQVSDIWGHGFPDMQAALSPVGTTSTMTSRGRVTDPASVSGTVTLGNAFGQGVTSLAASGYLYNDQLNGVFRASLSGNVTSAPTTALVGTLGDRMLADTMSSAATAGGMTFGFASSIVPTADGRRARANTVLSFAQMLGDRADVQAGFGFSPDTRLGFAPRHAALRSASLTDSAMGIPLLSLGDPRQGWIASGLTAGRVRSTLAGFSGGATERTARVLSSANRGRTQGFVSDTVVDLGSAQFALSAGQVTERDGFLGSRSTSALFAGTANNRFLRIATNVALGRGIGLRGNYVTATSRIAVGADGVFSRFDGVRSEAAAIDLTLDDVLLRGSRLTLGASQPLRVAAGRAALSLPQGVIINAPGDYRYAYDTKGVSLTPGGREIDYTVEWSQGLGSAARLALAGRAMRQPGHDASVGPAFAGFIGLRSAF
ncbi:S8 family serine peptidase [Sphingomonadaceae bacterium OTU29MARTA1]|nr:S8 family serine peptidase [Sphingomonadaceae bacterium OTU29MARTA1]